MGQRPLGEPLGDFGTDRAMRTRNRLGYAEAGRLGAVVIQHEAALEGLEAPDTEVRQAETSPAVQVSAVTMRRPLALAAASASAASVSWSGPNSGILSPPDR